MKQDEPVQVKAARGEAPLGRLYDYLKVDQAKIRRLPALDERLMQETESAKKLRIGTVRNFSPLKIPSDAVFYSLAEGDVGVMGVVSEGALYTRVHFTDMSLPAGARVFVYSLKNPDEFYGPYEGRGPSPDGEFWTPPMEGDGLVIEYFSPRGANDAGDAPFQVSEISHIYRNIFKKENSENAAGACNLEVTSAWAEVAKSVGELQFTSGGSEYLCTGTLLNNPTNDQTPYLLTAHHCFSTQAEAQTLRVYWNYSSGDSPPPGTSFTDGANLLATGAGSDFTFVRLTGSLPGGLFFSGWDANPIPSGTSVTGIHHPDGSHKRISFGTTTSPSSNFTNVRWSSGTTEPGSSGSGLWKGSATNPQLVGTLTGGAASCSTPTGIDNYGSFSVTYPSISSLLTGSSVDLSITNTAYDQVAPGSKIAYFITVSNAPGGTANSISVVDNLPTEVTFVSCGANGGTCGGVGNNRTITFPSLAAGTSATAILIATVNNSVAQNTNITNTATVSSASLDLNQSNNTATATATVSLTPLKPKANGRIVFGSDRAFTNSTQPTGIYTINADGTNESLLLNVDPFASAPAWSPDGSKVAYGKRGGNGTYGDEIYVANANGTGAVKVAGNVYISNSRIAWSPDGSKLAFIGTLSSIYVVNADGTGLSKLPVSPTNANDLSWSPDGSKFAYSTGDIFVMNVDGTGQTNLTQGKPNIQGEGARSILPRWSPDGTRLLFSAESINYKNVYVINADGTGLAPLITLHQSMQPGWSPDGAKITFIALNSLYVSNSDGTGQKPIANNGFYNFKPDWQPLASATVQLSANSYSTGEADGHLTITVNRSSSIGAATVDYATSDSSGLNPCSMVTTNASSRCDYATTVSTLRFAAGESSKTIFIPIVDDSLAEGTESFTLTLSNPTGIGLGTNSTATITITDNDTATGANPVDGASFFIRQQYIDFLGREPDPPGLQGWQNVLSGCGTTVAPPCDRIEVSAGFFRSPEFQDRGYFIYRFYSTVGKIPLYSDFMPDFAKVSGFLTTQQLEDNKVAFAQEFTTRSDFQTKYGGISDPTAFVNALLNTVGVTPPASTKQAWITGLTNGSMNRAQVLRAVAESQEVYNKYYNEAFVIMQYFGYLRRSADGSYVNWIQTMNSTNGDYRTMINGFLNSPEYRQRFGP